MLRRMTLVGVVVVSLLGAYASSAAAGTWAGAAADPRIAFPVYRPSQELGLHASVGRQPCASGPTGPYWVVANYGRRGSRAHVSVYESSPQPCGDPGEALPVTHVRIGGRSVAVDVFCKRPGCRGGVALSDGLRHGFLLFMPQPGGHGVPRTVIAITTTHVHLNALLRLARSLAPITRPKGPWPPVDVQDFLSPDGKIWCLIDVGAPIDRAWCVTRTPEHSAEVHRDGSVEVCTASEGQRVCTQDWGEESPRLHPGQSSQRGPYRCTGQAASVRCTVTSGAGLGNGFTIDAAGVTTIGPAATQSRAGTTYFFASPFGMLSTPNQLVVRPKGFPIFLDGQWVIEGLRWTHWGSKVARATGISDSSDDNPDPASGKRIKTHAKVTLSNPGPFRGHTVYRCVKVFVPPPADFGPRRCLKGKGKYAYFG